MSCRQDIPLDREKLDKKFDLILPIPLTKVHIYTLHGFVRITDKSVYLSILSAWNKSPKEISKKSIEAIENVLSKAGLHGRNVKICKDTKLSGPRGNVPCKPSMGGVKTRHFIEDSKERLEAQPKLYSDLIDAENDLSDRGNSAIRKKKVWMALSVMHSFMNKEKFDVGDDISFTNSVIDFTKQFVEPWGENHITHYMHIHYAHGPWFAKEYGSWQFGTPKEWKNPISKQRWLIKKTVNMEEVHHIQTH